MSFLSRLFKRGKDDRPAPAPPPAGPKTPRVPPARDRAAGPAAEPLPAPVRPAAPRHEAVPAPITAPSTHAPEVRRVGPAMEEQRAQAILESVLDNLGTAHHRPFSGG